MAALTRRHLACAACTAALAWPVVASAVDWQWRARVQAAHERFDGVHTDGGQTRDATWLRRADVSLRARSGPWRGDLALDGNLDGEPWLEVDEASLSWRGADTLSVRVGRFDPDFGLEPSGSSSDALAAEDSALWDLAPDAVDGSNALGIEMRRVGRDWHASAALLDQGDHVSGTARGAVFGQPWPTWHWHLGLSMAQQHGWRGDGRIRTRLGVRGVSEDHLGRRVTLAPGGDFERDRAAVFEAAVRAGPGHLQGEWLQRRLTAPEGRHRHARGWDLQAAWSLSGRGRHYDPDGARFVAAHDSRSVGAAWEIYLRATRLAVDGERSARLAALGLNTFLHGRGRVTVAWQRASLNEPVGPGLQRGSALLTRWQWRF